MNKIKNTTIILLTICLLLSGCSKKTPATAKAESNRSQKTVNSSSQNQTSGLTSTSQGNDTTPQHALPSINAGKPNRVVIANGEWNPYFSENLRYYGVVSRIVKEAFESEGIEVEYVFRPWKRGMEDAKKGRLNGTMGWGKKPDRLEVFDYSDEPIMETVTALFFRKNSNYTWNTLADLKELRISGTAGYYYGKKVEAGEQSGAIVIERGPDDKLNFMKLLEGRTDLVINDLDVGYALMATALSPEQARLITDHPVEVDSFPCYLLLAKDNPENARLLKLFNKGLETLRKSGKIDQYWDESRSGLYRLK